ncbi:hypothetical protein [Falsarthrobacter nasiphocae]|uniref:Uncharacterized protein n=1 Tax=Falsarthrobacter nasiphocae TaxID=189863 RepID=A0AAE3YEK7_9MICC|nr:hypothetical protein [Falsarthrobacter nasiphocae]MDR6892428.1 hypothetical protein [Falsarthrobacter nasiphocae]
MLKTIVRLSVFLLVGFALLVSDAYVKSRDSHLPLGAQHVLGVSVKKSPLSREEILAGLNVPVAEGQWIAKSVPDPQDFMHGRSLYRLTGSGPADGPIPWYDRTFHGDVHPVTQLGTANLDGTYLARLDEAQLADLTSWMRDNGITVSVQTPSTPLLVFGTILDNGYGSALAAAFLVMILCAVSWSMHRSASRAFRMAGGMPPSRILREDFQVFARLAAVPALAGMAIAALLVGLLRGQGALASFAAPAAVTLCGVAVATAASLLLVGALTRPSLAIIASRRPPVSGHAAVGGLVKAASVLLVALTLPSTATSIATAAGMSAQNAQWRVMGESVSLRVAFESEELFQEIMGDVAAFTGEQDKAGKALLSTSVPPTVTDEGGLGQHDGVFIVNRAYLNRVSRETGARFIPASPDTLGPQSSKDLANSLALWVRGTSRGASGISYLTVDPAVPRPVAAVSGTGNATLVTAQRPLLLTVDSIPDVFNPSFIGSIISQSGLVFMDAQSALTGIEKHGLQPYVLSVDRVADQGLERSQSEAYKAANRAFALALILLALIAGTVLSARVHCLLDRDRLFPRRIGGAAWTAVLRQRFVTEALVGILCAGLAFAVHAALDTPFAWAALLAVLVFAAVTVPAHLAAAQSVFRHTLARKA